MSDDEKKTPKWVKDSKEHLESIIPKVEAIKKEGQAEIKRGLEKLGEANDLLSEVNYLSQVLTQPHEPQYWNDEIVTISGGWMANRIEALDKGLDGILGLAKEEGNLSAGYHQRFMNALPSTDSDAGTAIYLGAGIERRFTIIEPTYSAVLFDFEPKRITSRDALFQDLKSILEPMGKQYVAMLDGSETALLMDTPDSQSQAAHSMRDCFQQLLEQLAPSKVVKSQPWFQTTDGAPGGISRRSRLRYMLYESGENLDDQTIQQLDDVTEIAKNSLDLCIARAHEHDPSLTKEEIQLVVDQGRNALLNVLKLYNSFRAGRS